MSSWSNSRVILREWDPPQVEQPAGQAATWSTYITTQWVKLLDHKPFAGQRLLVGDKPVGDFRSSLSLEHVTASSSNDMQAGYVYQRYLDMISKQSWDILKQTIHPF